jgi:lipopolysaccharide/colanic/teichoic acid biosynthesis glycosyltransferase
MKLQTMPTTNHYSPALSSDTTEDYAQHCKSKFKFLYIGTNADVVENFLAIFQVGFNIETTCEALNYFTENDFYNDDIPDVIFLDVPFQHQDTEAFLNYIKKENQFIRTTVIYSEKALTKEQKHLFKEKQLIDDIVNLTSSKIDFCAKVRFIKKVKKAESTSTFAEVDFKPRISTKRKLSITCKRIIDITIALVAILFLSPVFILIAIALKIESSGPIFYISHRAGTGFKVFKFYKFRSMVVNADAKIKDLSHLNQYETNDEKGPKFLKIKDDPRITKLGKLLRNTSMDELPQLFNVLKGDMSIVGNRPLPIYEAITLTTNTFVERFAAPAGITGLWQVNKRGNEDMSVEERISLDILYARNNNVLYDLKIIAKTPVALFQKSNV